jgi:hypothetical protein
MTIQTINTAAPHGSATIDGHTPNGRELTTGERLGVDIPASCPSVITGRALGMDAAAAVVLVEHVLIDPRLAELAQG